MKKIDELIVVEGKSDISFLSSFLNADFYQVNGSAVNEKDIAFLKEINKKRGIIVLTDPDFPGQKIRNYLNQNIEGLKNGFVRKSLSIKHNKVGVAESTKDEVLNGLNNLVTFKNVETPSIFMEDLINLGLSGQEDSKSLRNKVCEHFNIGWCNTKTFLKYVNMLGLTYKELEELINA